MCEGLGFIVSKDLNIYTTDPDHGGNCSHTDILKALGWEENTDMFNRKFIRVQMDGYDKENFEPDEGGSLPGWAEENFEQIRKMCLNALKKILPAYKEFIMRNDFARLKEYERDKAYDKAHDFLVALISDLYEGDKIGNDVWNEMTDKSVSRRYEHRSQTGEDREEELEKAYKLFLVEFRKIPGYVAPKVEEDEF